MQISSTAAASLRKSTSLNLEKVSSAASTTKITLVKDDINYDDDPLFYYEQNKSINFMKHFKAANNNGMVDGLGDEENRLEEEEEELLRQNNLNEIETTLNLESNQSDEKRTRTTSNVAYKHLDNLAFEDFNQDDDDDDDDDNEENRFENYDDYNRNDYADADEDELGYFNINK